MLTQLHIENIALIRHIDIEFDSGFTVFTGETGAGKSLIMRSIAILCGAKFEKDIIRIGEQKGYVEGCFDVEGDDINRFITENDISIEDGDSLVLSREITPDGKSRCKINGRTVSLSTLKKIAEIMIDIHGQNDMTVLSNSAARTAFIDGYADNLQQRWNYSSAYDRYTSINSEYQKLKEISRDSADKLDLINFKLSQIESAHLKSGEEEALTTKRNLLKNEEKIFAAASSASSKLFYAERYNASEFVYSAINDLKRVSAVVPTADDIITRLEAVKIEIDDIAETVREWTSETETNPDAALDKIESRLAEISALKHRFNAEVDDIIILCQKLESERELISDISEKITESETALKDAEKILYDSADVLRKSRKLSAAKLSKAVIEHLSELDMKSFAFDIVFTQKAPSPNGADETSFNVSANKGEALKPIEKSASGGELSRFMLALKSAFCEAENTSVMIFDEIDVGVSGGTSSRIGIKLKNLSANKKRQVICVTHSAQIAALCDRHYCVRKREINERVETSVELLDDGGRINETARIIGGLNISDNARRTAEEMIQNGKK